MKKGTTARKTLCALFCLAFALSALIIPASAAERIMDNDALPNSGVTNPKKDGESYGWFNMSYVESGNYYNGDARKGRSTLSTPIDGNYGSRYCWRCNIPSKSITLYAYLWDVSFTDPKAKYETLSTLSGSTFGRLDQNRASYGWNYVGYATGVTSNLFAVTSSTNNTTYLGADAIKVTY